MPTPRAPEAKREEAVALYLSGLSAAEAARCVGYTQGAVLKWLQEQGIPRRSKVEHLAGPKNPTRGKKRSPEIVAKLVEASKNRSGSRHYNWKGGLAPLNNLVRVRLKPWTQTVFKRDGYTCQGCNQKHGDIEAHHLVTFSELMQRVLPEIPQDLNLDQQAELIANHPLFQDLDNGVTVCHTCHELLHGKAHGRRTKKTA